MLHNSDFAKSIYVDKKNKNFFNKSGVLPSLSQVFFKFRGPDENLT